MPWTVLIFVAAAMAPVVIGMTALYLRARGVPRLGGLVLSFYAGLALGAVGGLIVCALVIGLALLLRSTR